MTSRRGTSHRPRARDGVPAFSAVLRDLMRRPNYTATPGLLGKLSGVPRATIVNWLEGRVSKPRHWDDLMKVADALRLGDLEIEALLEAAGHPPLSVLRERESSVEERHVGARAPHHSSPLPAQLTELIGRDVALTTVRERICRADTRLVTLVGTGGVGKTHLAIAIAQGLHAAFKDGIVWVPLAAVDDPAQVTSRIFQALGIRETSGASAIKSLSQALQSERVLLVLDNLEQLLSAAPALSDVLENTEHLKMLVTSRAALRIRGEREFQVAPLPLPDLADLPPTELLHEYAAVALFVKRAQAYRGEFLLTPENARTIATICARLDGLPLALELAAARTTVLTPIELLRRLESRLTLLTNGTRDSNLRQQTLRNTIAWSYALLSTEQQRVFRRIAVLTGGISFSAAGAIAEVDVEHDLRFSNNLFEALASIADQSLLSTVASPGDREPRFAMLETIREYALQLLSEHAELEQTRHRHAHYFLRLAEMADTRFASQPTIEWMQSFQLEYENIRAALHYFIDDTNDIGHGARLVAALGRFWFERGLFHEGRGWLERIRGASAAVEPATDAKILLYLAFVANYESDYKAGADAAQHALKAYTHSNDRIGIAQATNALGIAAMYTGRYDEAETFFTTAYETYRDLGDDRGVAVELHNLGEIASECRLDFPLAASCYEQSLAIFRRLGHSMNVGSTLGVLAELRAHNGDIDAARALALEALATYRRIDNQPLIAEELTRLARYELSGGNIGDARMLLRGAVEHLKMAFHARHIVRCLEAFASLAVQTGAYLQAARLLGFTQKMRIDYQLPHLPAWEREHEKLTLAISAKLTPAHYASNVEDGWRIDLARVFNEALQI